MKLRSFLFAVIMIALGNSVSAQCNEDLSLYREYYKQWSAAKFNLKNLNPQMVTSWRNVFINCPTAKQQTYLDGVNIIPYVFINNPEYKDKKEAYIDTLILVFDKRAEYFPKNKNGSQVGEIMGRKAIALQKWAPSRVQQTYEAFKQCVDLDGELMNVSFIVPFFQEVIIASKEKVVDETAILDEYDRLMGITDAKIRVATEANDTKALEDLGNVKAGLDGLVEPYANCEDLIRIYTPKFEAEPNNPELLTKISNMLDKKGCDDSPLYLSVAMNLHKIQPSPESAYLIGKKLLKQEKYGEAKGYLIEATKSQSMDRAAQAYKYLAQICLINKSYEQGRDYARKATSLDRTDGEPYIIIGSLYAESAKSIGSNEFESKVAYWAAVDQFVKAKQVQPSIAEKANKYIAAYSQNFPSVETIFFYGYEEGQQYTVGGWINETTTVRAGK